MKAKQLIASAPTEQGLLKLINGFYYSKNYIIKDNKAYNTKLDTYMGEVKLEKGRYKFYV